MPTSNHRSRFVLWLIELALAINVIYLSATPLLRSLSDGFNTNGYTSDVEYILTGSGFATTSFWLRLVAIAAGISLFFLWPRRRPSAKVLKWRARACLTLFVLYFYVFILSTVFGNNAEFLWLQPLVYSAIMGAAYFANSQAETIAKEQSQVND